jgi:leucyl-tRNA synthetase
MEFKKIEDKWQKSWEKEKIFEVKEKGKKFYVLEMFPYPSGEGLHVGHSFNYILADIFARFKIMHGFNVLHPVGYDSLGLPAENAAIKAGIHPKEYIEKSIERFMYQQKKIGISYNWDTLLMSHDSEYYKWDQWIFLKMLRKGLAFRKKAPVNYCRECNTVLANEQVHNGRCWRHKDTEIEIKHLEQWFFKITDYAEELYDNIERLKDWPKETKALQRNWIGKSNGIDIDFKVNNEKWSIFTTRPDTIYGVTFMVISAQHSKLMGLVTPKQKKEVEILLKKIKSTSEKDQIDLEKEGVFTGSYAMNPLTKEKIPIYVGNFVVAEYGSGMVMAVPAHDQRDFEFAKKYKLPIKQVIVPNLENYQETLKTLRTLEKIKEAADKKKIKFWLLGGLANVFHAGIIYRAHDDIDLIVKNVGQQKDFEKILISEGFKKVSEKELTKKLTTSIYKNKEGIEIDIGPNIEEFGLKDEDFVEDEKELDGVKCLVISKRYLRNFKKDMLKKRDESKDKTDLQYLDGKAFVDEGEMVNSREFNDMNSEKAIEKINNYLEKEKLGKRTVQYKLRDWLISRQRYWGTPIPVIYCDKCGITPVPEKDLPVKLPEKVEFGKGNPLETNKEFVNTKCPKCKGNAKRETDTMDTFVNSSWYFLRYCDPKNKKDIFDKKKVASWMPIDFYIGGREHACMHLIYFRFYTKFLRDIGLLKIDEPCTRLIHNGMIHGNDGYVMSKSRGNVVDPLDIIEKYSADILRIYLVSVASPETDFIWSDKGIEASSKFINKIAEYFSKIKFAKSSPRLESKLNKTIKEVTEDIENFKYNLAIIKLRSLFDSFRDIDKVTGGTFLKMLNPFCPHITEELWERLGNKKLLASENWPVADESKIDKQFEEDEKAQERLKEDIRSIIKMIGKKAKGIYVYVVPGEINIYQDVEDDIKREHSCEVKIYPSNKAEHDPEGKSRKAKPGKPSILIDFK